MSTDATSASASATSAPVTSPRAADKGKGKIVQAAHDDGMDEDDENDEDEDDEEGDEDEDGDEEMAEDESLDAIDPSAILAPGTRRTRGAKVDYTSPEALAKAGLKPEDLNEDEDEEMRD